jgi:hypothetical protein
VSDDEISIQTAKDPSGATPEELAAFGLRKDIASRCRNGEQADSYLYKATVRTDVREQMTIARERQPVGRARPRIRPADPTTRGQVRGCLRRCRSGADRAPRTIRRRSARARLAAHVVSAMAVLLVVVPLTRDAR